MRAGYKVAAAGLVVVLGCCAVALAPFDLPLLSDAVSHTATAQPTSAGTASDASDAAGGPAYRDGVYRATGTGKLGPVYVTVTVEDGRIANVQVDANAEVPAMAEAAQATVVPQIVERQSAEGIDAAAGATVTSDAIVAAVADALARAAL